MMMVMMIMMVVVDVVVVVVMMMMMMMMSFSLADMEVALALEPQTEIRNNFVSLGIVASGNW